MFKPDDAYSYMTLLPMKLANGTVVGLLALEYRVKLYNDVQVQNAGSVTANNRNQQFIVQCTQRVILNPIDSSVAPSNADSTSEEKYENYPAMLCANMLLSAGAEQILQLLEYSPHTVNTAVSQSQTTNNSSGQSGSNESSTSSTTGSSLQQSSTYGVTVTLGDTFSGVSANYEHSQARESNKSKTMAQSMAASRSTGSDTSLGSSMSIKDWGTYASVNGSTVCPSWVFGQEYPWSAIEAKFYTDNSYEGNGRQYEMRISSAMASNLYSKDFLYPPSELSMFGVNFLMKSSWRVIIDDTASTNLTFKHAINYYLATHVIENDLPVVYMDKSPTLLLTAQSGSEDQTASITLDANLMALDPVGNNSDSAILGFMPNGFIPPLAAIDGSTTLAPKGFKILAATNDLMALDTTTYPSADSLSGFSASQTSLTAIWSTTQNFPYQLTLYFKVVDSVREYKLYLKHWKAKSCAVKIDLVVNDLTGNPMTKYVDSLEGEGGENNVHVIALRDLDFTSIDYHDYLKLGLNSITVTFTPINDGYADCSYQLRAVSIEAD